MTQSIAFFKPYEVLCQFTDLEGRKTLKDFIDLPGIYSAGRLDYRSEGLLILSNDGTLIHRLTDPIYEHPKTYYVQVEGIVTPEAVSTLMNSIVLPDLQGKLAYAEIIPEPNLPARSKAVRLYHPTTWLKIILREGKKHQVRRMTATRSPHAAVGSLCDWRPRIGEFEPWRMAQAKIRRNIHADVEIQVESPDEGRA